MKLLVIFLAVLIQICVGTPEYHYVQNSYVSHTSMGPPSGYSMSMAPPMGMQGGPQPGYSMGMPPQMAMQGGPPPQMNMGMPPQMNTGMPPQMGMQGGPPPQMNMGMPPQMNTGMPPQMGMQGQYPPNQPLQSQYNQIPQQQTWQPSQPNTPHAQQPSYGYPETFRGNSPQQSYDYDDRNRNWQTDTSHVRRPEPQQPSGNDNTDDDRDLLAGRKTLRNQPPTGISLPPEEPASSSSRNPSARELPETYNQRVVDPKGEKLPKSVFVGFQPPPKARVNTNPEYIQSLFGPMPRDDTEQVRNYGPRTRQQV